MDVVYPVWMITPPQRQLCLDCQGIGDPEQDAVGKWKRETSLPFIA